MEDARYSVSSKDAATLLIYGHEYHRKLGAGQTNGDGSVPWRCKNQRISAIKCKGSVTLLTSGEIRTNAGHSENCPLVIKEDELNVQLKSA